jgi:hypothetical protein
MLGDNAGVIQADARMETFDWRAKAITIGRRSSKVH